MGTFQYPSLETLDCEDVPMLLVKMSIDGGMLKENIIEKVGREL
jgi:hypothetical protein